MNSLADYENITWRDIRIKFRDTVLFLNVLSSMAIVAGILSLHTSKLFDAILIVTVLLLGFNIAVKASSNKDIKWYQITDFDQIMAVFSFTMSAFIIEMFRDKHRMRTLAIYVAIQIATQLKNLGMSRIAKRSGTEKQIICKKLLCTVVGGVLPTDRNVVYDDDGGRFYKTIGGGPNYYYVEKQGRHPGIEWSLTEERIVFRGGTQVIECDSPNLSKKIGELRTFMRAFDRLTWRSFTFEFERKSVIEQATSIFDTKTAKYIEYLVNGDDYDSAFGKAYGTTDAAGAAGDAAGAAGNAADPDAE